MLILDVLSTRQLDVLKGVMRGHSNLDIANDRGITEGNVKWHMTNILKLYDVTTRARLIVKVAELDQREF